MEFGICFKGTVSPGEAAGRDMSNFRVMSAAPAYFGSLDECVDASKWFPAMVGKHVILEFIG